MVYKFGLTRHANVRYRDSAIRLSCCELSAMLRALSIDCEVRSESLGGADFLSFVCRPLSPGEVAFLSGHSSVLFLSEDRGGLLSPLAFEQRAYLGEDLPEVLKYKGKTAVPFIRMIMNMALSLSPFCFSAEPLTLLDPLCGKGTCCFCALQSGMNAIGLDRDRKALRESADYFSRYLKFHLLKHSSRRRSETAGSRSIPVQEFVFADTKDHFQQGLCRTLLLAEGDTADAPALVRRSPVHLLIADLPYGVQHAPSFGSRPESFRSLLARALPAWKKALLPGGVAALSFNTLTLPTRDVQELARSAGFVPCTEEPFLHLRHEVEQAVVRDVVFLINQSPEGGMNK